MGSINISGNSQVQTSTGASANVPLSVQVTTSGSSVWNTNSALSTSWVGLDTGSLGNSQRYFSADNVGTTWILLSSNIAGTQIFSTLQPNDNVLLPLSQSQTVYAYSSGSGGQLLYTFAAA